jgi:hypothetical protein
MFVSFPPLSNMLKFSGYSYFIRDLISIACVCRGREATQTQTGGSEAFTPLPYSLAKGFG